MIDLKELAEANRHCIDHNCNGCPFQNRKECEKREEINTEMIYDFMDMIGFK